MSNEYKVQIIHLDGSIFIYLFDVDNEEDARKETEAQYFDQINNGVSVLWAALWDKDKVIDTFGAPQDFRDIKTPVWGKTILTELFS